MGRSARSFARRAALAVLAGVLASAAARAVLTDGERAMVLEMQGAAAAVEAAGRELMANPGLEPDLRDEAGRIARAGREMGESMALVLGASADGEGG